MARRTQESDSDFQDVVKRLDAILNVLLEMPAPDGKKLSMLKRVELLNSSGLRNVEIANILGESQTYIGVILNKLRKRETGTKHQTKA